MALVQESLDDSIRMSYHNAQSVIHLVEYSVMEPVLLDLLCNDVIDEIVGAHKAKCFYTDAAADRLSKELPTSSSFMVPIATFEQRKTDSAIVDRNIVLAMASKKEHVAATETLDDLSENHQGHRTWGARSPTVAGPPDVDLEIVMQRMKAPTFNNVHPRRNR